MMKIAASVLNAQCPMRNVERTTVVRWFCRRYQTPLERLAYTRQAYARWLSVRLAASTTLVLLAIGIPIAYWLVFSPRRWKVLVEAVVALPLVLPPTVLGFYVLMAIGPFSPVGRAYARLAPVIPVVTIEDGDDVMTRE